MYSNYYRRVFPECGAAAERPLERRDWLVQWTNGDTPCRLSTNRSQGHSTPRRRLPTALPALSSYHTNQTTKTNNSDGTPSTVHYLVDGQYKSINVPGTYQQQTYKISFQRWMLRKSRVTKRLGFASDRFYLIHRVGAKKGLIIEILIGNSPIFFQKIGFYKP